MSQKTPMKLLSNLQGFLNMYSEHVGEFVPDADPSAIKYVAGGQFSQMTGSGTSSPATSPTSSSSTPPRHIPRQNTKKGSRQNSVVVGSSSPVDDATDAVTNMNEHGDHDHRESSSSDADSTMGSHMRLTDDGVEVVANFTTAKPTGGSPNKSVKFPDDDQLVTGFCDAWHAPFHRATSMAENGDYLFKKLYIFFKL
jgi:hypothetical protein